MQHKVIFQPSGRRGEVQSGVTLLQAAHELGVDIESPCGAAQVCGKCKVKIERGYFDKFDIDSRREHLSPLAGEEQELLSQHELRDDYRLACCATVLGDILVFVPEESRGAQQVVLETGAARNFKVDPALRSYPVSIQPPSLDDQRSDLRRLQDALAETYGLESLSIDYFALTELPNILRRGQWQATAAVLHDREIISVRPGLDKNLYGIGIDVGTTTVAAYLCDGEDVLSRISFAMANEDGRSKLQQAIIEGLNNLIAKMTAAAGLTCQDVHLITLVFNTVMHHCLLNIEPSFIGRSPFVAAIRESFEVKARDLGIRVAPSAVVHVLPVESGFVGPDNVSVLIAEEPHHQDQEIRLLIDIGTNGEIDLGNRRKLLSTSCATGPALEGAQIKFGMRAAPGAIERVRIDPLTLECSFRVIGDDRWHERGSSSGAKGICGSGIIDMMAEIFKAGIIDRTGRFNKKLQSGRIRKDEHGRPEYILAFAADTDIGRDITVTQGDVRAVQLAKAALYAGAKILMRRLGVSKIDRVTLAGAFGSYIDRESALVIGLFPDCELEKVQAVGNAAGDGAQLALLNKEKMIEASTVAEAVEFVETATEPDFQKHFTEAMMLPHAVDRFPSVQAVLDRIPGLYEPRR
jgi:uncharacterized 2Fe-2S/4Fe-4S cluster protein (DUF4445 family)